MLVFVGTAFVNNFVLTKFLGLCPFMGVSGKLDQAGGMAIATGFVLTLAAGLSHLLDHYLLVPLGVDHLRTLSFILVIALVVQLTELLTRWRSPLLYRRLGIFLPLITTNCAVLGVALINSQRHANLLSAMVYGLGAAAGFAIALILFACLRERIIDRDVPELLRGAPIALVTAGIMALAFMGFAGMDRGV